MTKIKEFQNTSSRLFRLSSMQLNIVALGTLLDQKQKPKTRDFSAKTAPKKVSFLTAFINQLLSAVKMATICCRCRGRKKGCVPIFIEIATSYRLKRTLVNPLCQPYKLISEYIHKKSRPNNCHMSRS